jgi:hypothetical protein
LWRFVGALRSWLQPVRESGIVNPGWVDREKTTQSMRWPLHAFRQRWKFFFGTKLLAWRDPRPANVTAGLRARLDNRAGKTFGECIQMLNIYSARRKAAFHPARMLHFACLSTAIFRDSIFSGVNSRTDHFDRWPAVTSILPEARLWALSENLISNEHKYSPLRHRRCSFIGCRQIEPLSRRSRREMYLRVSQQINRRSRFHLWV